MWTRSKTRQKQQAHFKKLDEVNVFASQQPQSFVNFMCKLAAELYLDNMLNSDRYITADIDSLDIEKQWSDDVVVDGEDGCRYFYSQYVPPNERKSAQEIQKLLDKYVNSREYLFQLLYRKYINTSHEMDPQPSVFVM